MATLGLPVAYPGFFSGGGSSSQSGCTNLYLPVMFMFSQVSVCLGGICPIAYLVYHNSLAKRDREGMNLCWLIQGSVLMGSATDIVQCLNSMNIPQHILKK